jgi:type IV secretion system protein VirB11
MTLTFVNSESRERRRAMLRSAMGPAIGAALADPAVIEVMVNPDGSLRLDRLGEGRVDTGERLQAAEVERIIRLVASHVRVEVHASNSVVSAELPETGERFEGLLPPVALAPCFAIRKPAPRIYTLDDFVADRVMGPLQAEVLRRAVAERRNLLIAGGTSSGKTTLANAILAELAKADERVVIIEDTRELQCAAADCVALRTKPGIVSLADLVCSTLRLRPDRIVVGEVRGPEALDMLKAWNTGHPGGIATVHANSAHAALYRLEQLIQEAVVAVPASWLRRPSISSSSSAAGATRAGSSPSRASTASMSTATTASPSCRRLAFTPFDPKGDPMHIRLAHILAAAVLGIGALCLPEPALAAGSNMPWEAPLTAVLESIEGPVARIIAVIIIIITGLSLAFGDTSGGFRRLLQIVFGLSIAFAATSFFLAFFSFGGGALVS